MKQSCLLKITWPKKVIPTKSYSLAMLYLHHTKYLIMHNPDDKPSNCFILFNALQLFSTLTQYMSASHGHSIMVVYGGGCKDKREEKVSHQLGVSTGYGDAH